MKQWSSKILSNNQLPFFLMGDNWVGDGGVTLFTTKGTVPGDYSLNNICILIILADR
jgi:hypothetical protein